MLTGRLLPSREFSLLQLCLPEFGLDQIKPFPILAFELFDLLLQFLAVLFSQGFGEANLAINVADEELGRFHVYLEAEVEHDLDAFAAGRTILEEVLLELHQVLEIVDELRILMVLEDTLNFDVLPAQEEGALLLTTGLVDLLHLSVLLLHLLFELLLKSGLYVSNCGFVEELESRPFGYLVLFLEFFFEERPFGGRLLVESPFEEVEGLVKCFVTLVAADVGPGVLNRRDGTLVDRLHVGLDQVPKHVSIQLLTVYHLGTNSLEDLASQHHHLLRELRPQLVERDVDQVLQLVLVR